MIKLVVFDWNGTLFDDTKIVLEAVNASEVKVLGIPPINLKRYRDTYDVPLHRFYENLGVSRETFDAKSAEIAAKFHPIYEPLAAHARTRPGTKKTLQKLQKQGISCVILSNHTVEGIYLQLSRLKLVDLFDAVLANGGTEEMHHTSKQHRLEVYLKENAITPAETIIVGDTVEEIRIGHNLGLRAISITGGNNSERRLRDAQPTAIIHTVTELIDLMEVLS